MRRRTFLAGAGAGTVAVVAGAGVLAEHEVIPGRVPLQKLLHNGGKPGEVPDVAPGVVRAGALDSARRGKRVAWTVAYPPAAAAGAALPLCVVLHGRGVGAAALTTIGYPRFLAAAVRDGVPPFAFAAIDGGDAYWHPRADGDDPAGMVTEEFLPLLADLGLSTDRFALLGWSMGGYGALRLAADLGPDRVVAVDAESPALWRHAADAAPGAFDDAADFERNDVFRRTGDLSRIPVRIACGTADAFRPAAEAFAAALPTPPQTFFEDGTHTDGFWRASAPAATAFIGRRLTP